MAQPFDPVRAVQYGAFVDAAYAMYNGAPTSLQPTPNVPLGWTMVAWIQMSDFAFGKTVPVFYGFIAQSTANPKSFVLALRGTESPMEWWDNFHAIMTPFSRVPKSGSVSSGFVTIYDTITVVPDPKLGLGGGANGALPGSFAEQVALVVKAATPASGGGSPLSDLSQSSIVVTGHSLGAALCTLYVLENTTKGTIQNPLICTFASPLVGNQAFANAFNALDLTSWRIANEPDLVPKVPWPIFGYVHVNALTQIDSTGKVKSTLSCAHAMATYLAMLDPSLTVGSDCSPAAEDANITGPGSSGGDAIEPAGGGGPAVAVLPAVRTPDGAVSVTVNVFPK